MEVYHEIQNRMLILLSMFLSAVPLRGANSWYVKFNEGNKNITYFRDSLRGYDSSNWAKTDTTGIFTNFINSTVQNDDTVYIASGHYKITSSINFITKKIKLYGGFSGKKSF